MSAPAARGPGPAPRNLRADRRLYLGAALAGVLTGLLGAGFHALLDQAGALRTVLPALAGDWGLPPWLLLPGVCALTLTLAAWLVRRFAPETAGSGVQEIEAVLAGEHPVRWARVLPVKFVAGVLAIGSGLVLGREGPTVHLGGALGQWAGDGLGLDARRVRVLVAAGAAAGLAAAFNAPLAAIVFVTEELRDGFEYGFQSIQSVILASVLAVAVSGWLLGQGPALPVTVVHGAPIGALPLFVALGAAVGVLGVLFNRLLLGSVRVFKGLRAGLGVLPAALTGLGLGLLLLYWPESVGGGEALVEALLARPPVVPLLLLLLAIRLLTTVGSYGLGLPGVIFAPLLALGTIVGALFDALAQGPLGALWPGAGLGPGVFAVTAMGALFAATVRAPLTGTVLAIELTGALALALPILLTCLAATFVAEALGGRPVYSLLLAAYRRPAPSPADRGRIGRTLSAPRVAPGRRPPDI